MPHFGLISIYFRFFTFSVLIFFVFAALFLFDITKYHSTYLLSTIIYQLSWHKP